MTFVNLPNELPNRPNCNRVADDAPYANWPWPLRVMFMHTTCAVGGAEMLTANSFGAWIASDLRRSCAA